MKQHFRWKANFHQRSVGPCSDFRLTGMQHQFRTVQISTNSAAQDIRKYGQVASLVQQIARPRIAGTIENQLAIHDGKAWQECVSRNCLLANGESDAAKEFDNPVLEFVGGDRRH